MLAAGSAAGRPRVLSGLGRDIVGGGRQHRGRLIKLCLVPSVGFADAVVARVGIFSMLAAGSGAGRPRVLSGLGRDIVGGGRQHRRRLIKLCLVPSVGFANAVVARVGIFSMVADEQRRRAAPSPEQPEAQYRWRRSAVLETTDPSASCSRRGFANAVVARIGIFSMVGDESGAGRPRVLSSLRRTIVGGG